MSNNITIAILANGTFNNLAFHQNVLRGCNKIICADGGANYAKQLNVTPHYVIGDMDSITSEILADLEKNNVTTVMRNNDQNKTDLELAIALAESLNPKSIIILGAIGDEMDHTLVNIACLMKINANILARIIDDKNEMTLVQNQLEIIGEKDDVVSVMSLTEVRGLTYQGLKWIPQKTNVPFGWFGVRNKMLGQKAKIELQTGKVLVIKSITS